MKQFVAKSTNYLEKIKFAWLCSTEYNLIHGVEIEILILKCTISLLQVHILQFNYEIILHVLTTLIPNTLMFWQYILFLHVLHSQSNV